MNVRNVLDLYRYTDWANARLADALRALPAEAALRKLDGSFPTIRDLLVHLVGADWIWLERFLGASPPAIPQEIRAGNLPFLCDQLAAIGARRREFLRGLAEKDLAATLSFRYLSGAADTLPLRDALFHVVNHSTYHRGQLASMLRAVGAAPPATDFTLFRAEREA